MSRRSKLLVTAALVAPAVVCLFAWWRPWLCPPRSANGTLRRALTDVNAVRAFGDTPFLREELIFVLHGSDAKAFAGELQVLEPPKLDSEGWVCCCGGQYRLEFERPNGDTLDLTVHHGKTLRWRRGLWRGDMALTPDARAELASKLGPSLVETR